MVDHDRNLNPHAEARIAMAIWGREYGRQSGGSMDFWDSRTKGQQKQCADIVDRILASPRAEGIPPVDKLDENSPRYSARRMRMEIDRVKNFERRTVLEEAIVIVAENDVATAIRQLRALMAGTSPADLSGVRPATAEDVNRALDPANEVLGGAFMAGFQEGWIYSEIDADGERYQEMAEEYAMAVDTAPGEAWDAHREKFFAMLPLASIPEMGAPIADTEAEIARVVQSVNEWDDRTSPDEYPEHLLITSEELTLILRNFAVTLEGSKP